MNDRLRIVVLYALFAAIAIAANLSSQLLMTTLYRGPSAITISIVVGTLVGLPIKYVLDKNFIFAFTANDIRHDGRLFTLYAFMALVTTAIFWATEWLFELVFHTNAMRLVGGAIGLIVGYLIKYRLDKKYVFVTGER